MHYYYEKFMIFDPNLDDSAVEDTVGKLRDLIARQGGEVLKTENWGRRKLAYELNKHQKGNYVLLLFKAPPATIAEIERLCKVTDPIIKFMIIKLTKKKQLESVLASIAQAAKKETASPAPEKPVTAEASQPAVEVKPDVQ